MCIRDRYISASKEGLGVSTETVKEMNLKIYPVGSILCTSSCDLGKCAIVTRELVSNQRFINIIPDSNTNSDYLYYLMLSNAERLNHLSTGTIQANLSRKAFEHLMVQFPPISEQKAIAEYLDRKCEAVELSINKKQELIDRLSSYKKSLIYEVVTGKKEVYCLLYTSPWLLQSVWGMRVSTSPTAMPIYSPPDRWRWLTSWIH